MDFFHTKDTNII